MAKSMVHLNGNVLCTIDVETTGLDPQVHDLVQICILPLDSNVQPLKMVEGKKILPFYMMLKPKRPETAQPEAMKKHGLKMSDLMTYGVDPFKAADLLEEWVEALKLPFRKQIAPLGQHYTFDRSFIIEWLGTETYNSLISYYIRDTITSAAFINDRAAFQGEAAPFPKLKLTYLASQLGVEHHRAHDALGDCLVTAEIYRRMLQQPQW